MSTQYRPLEKDFLMKPGKGSGPIQHHFKQVFRDGDLAVYEVRSKGGTQTSYDAIRIRKNEERVIDGVTLEASESYPPDKAWGIDAFTFQSKSDAINKGISKLEKRIEEKAEPAPKSIAPIKFPVRFTVKELAAHNSIPLSQAYTEIKTNSRIQECDKIKTGARGKPSVVYRYV